MNTKQQLQLVTFEQAKRLREAGFDWFVYHWYNSDGTLSNSTNPHDRNGGRCGLSAPTVALALKWIRDEKNIVRTIKYIYGGTFNSFYKYSYGKSKDTYDEAESALLDELLTLIEKAK